MSSERTPRDALRERSHASARRRFWRQHDRDSYRCPGCDSTEGDSFEVHHRDGDWLNNHAYNLVAVCRGCHTRLHRLKNIRERLSEMRSAVTQLQEAP